VTVRYTWLSAIGDRTIPVAAARVWNSQQLQQVTSATSLSVFRICLKWTHLFRRRFPRLYPPKLLLCLRNETVIVEHINRSCHLTYLLTYLQPQALSQNFVLAARMPCARRDLDSYVIRPGSLTRTCFMTVQLAAFRIHEDTELAV